MLTSASAFSWRRTSVPLGYVGTAMREYAISQVQMTRTTYVAFQIGHKKNRHAHMTHLYHKLTFSHTLLHFRKYICVDSLMLFLIHAQLIWVIGVHNHAQLASNVPMVCSTLSISCTRCCSCCFCADQQEYLIDSCAPNIRTYNGIRSKISKQDDVLSIVGKIRVWFGGWQCRFAIQEWQNLEQ